MHINNVSFIFINSEKYISMTLFSGQPALSYDGTMHYSFDYAQQIQSDTLSSLFSASGPFVLQSSTKVSVFWCLCWRLWYVHIQYKAVHIVHNVLLIIFKIFQTAHTMYVASKLVHVVYIVDYSIVYWKRTDMRQWHEDSTKSRDATHKKPHRIYCIIVFLFNYDKNQF